MRPHAAASVVLLLLAATAAHAQPETPDALLQKSRAVLSPLAGDVKLPGLKQPVEVLRDRWGVPHIYAQNLDDLFFAQGVVVAQDRLFQIDWWRRNGVGETAEVLGPGALEADRFARLLRFRGDLKAEWASYGPDAERVATAFTNGINAWIDHIGDRLPLEFQLLKYRPKKWRPEDCLHRMSGIYMTSNFRQELLRASLVDALGLDKARLVLPTDPPAAFAPTPGLDLAGLDGAVLNGFRAATAPLRFGPPPSESNNWVVAGSRSHSGQPLLASDPHRATALPSLRYLVHLHAPGYHAVGAGEPGLPGIALGHNDHIAWGITIVTTDQADLYVEKTRPGAPDQYLVGEGWQAMKTFREQIAVKGQAKPAEVELRYTRHGPVLYQDEKRQRAVALKWVGSEPGAAAYLGGLAVARAKNKQEFLETLTRWKVPALNFVYADKDGHVGWVAAGLTPVRKGWNGTLPVPGHEGKYEWQGFLKVTELPQRFDPPTGYLATANHNILPEKYPHFISADWSPPYRAGRVRQRLEGQDKFTLDDFRDIQHEVTSLAGLDLVRVLEKLDLPGAREKAAARQLLLWNGKLTRESLAGAVYAVWLQELQREFYRPHVPKELLDAVAPPGLPALVAAVTRADPAWFGKDAVARRDELVRTTLTRALDRLDKLAKDGRRPAWGELHRVTFSHPLASLGPAHAKLLNLGPLPRPGDAHTPNNTAHRADFQQIHGATYRHLFDLADWDRGLATSAPGQSGQPGSPHYTDLLPLWDAGEYFPLPFSRGRVEQTAVNRLWLRPG